MVGVTGACGGNGRVEGMAKEISEGDARWGGFDGFDGAGAFKHARLGGHDGTLFYTVAEKRHRREKRAVKARFSRNESRRKKKITFLRRIVRSRISFENVRRAP